MVFGFEQHMLYVMLIWFGIVCVLTVGSIYCPSYSRSVHDDAMTRKHFAHHWSFVRRIHRSPVVPQKRANNAELMCFLFSETAVEQATAMPVIWDTMTHVTLLCNDASHWLGANLESALYLYIAAHLDDLHFHPLKNKGELHVFINAFSVNQSFFDHRIPY